MPIHDVGYREWSGKTTSGWFRWLIISRTGLRLALKSSWVRRILFAAWLPLMYWSVGFFMIEKSLQEDTSSIDNFISTQFAGVPRFEPIVQAQKEIKKITGTSKSGTLAVEKLLRNGYFRYFPQSARLADAYASQDIHRIRKTVWRWLMMVFFRYPQSVAIVFLIGLVTPTLIARDIRSRAFLMYFSRPVGKLDYIFGKLMVPSVFIMIVTTFPALAMYVFAVFMSPDLSVLYSTWDIPLRILVASVTLIVPIATLALAFSSLTQESRFATFSWFAALGLGHGTYLAVWFSAALRLNVSLMDPRVSGDSIVDACSRLSLYNCLGDVQAAIFGFASFDDVWKSAGVLSLISVVSVVVLFRRVSSATHV